MSSIKSKTSCFRSILNKISQFKEVSDRCYCIYFPDVYVSVILGYIPMYLLSTSNRGFFDVASDSTWELNRRVRVSLKSIGNLVSTRTRAIQIYTNTSCIRMNCKENVIPRCLCLHQVVYQQKVFLTTTYILHRICCCCWFFFWNTYHASNSDIFIHLYILYSSYKRSLSICGFAFCNCKKKYMNLALLILIIHHCMQQYKQKRYVLNNGK